VSDRVFIGLGANLGDPRRAIDDALDALAARPDVRLTDVSSLYRSAPVDADGPDFINAVARVDTTLPPDALLQVLHEIEHAFGRQRSYRNAPRLLDLDLLLYDDRVIDAPGLCLPHPRMHARAFVLAPLSEIAPDCHVPGHGTVDVLLAACADQPVTRLDGTRVAGARRIGASTRHGRTS